MPTTDAAVELPDFFDETTDLAGLEERVYRTRIRPDDWEPNVTEWTAGRGPGGPVFLGAFPSNSPAWHELRKTRLGGSEIGTVVGLNKFGSAYTLWHAKVSDEDPEDISDRPAIEWGHRLEPAVGGKLVEGHPELFLVPQVGTFAHSERPWQLANPDLLGPGAIGEVKTAGYDYAWGEPGTDQIPISYRAQVLWYMDVMGLDVAHVCVLITGRDYREYVVPYDLADALYLREAGQHFMDSIRDGTPPEPDGSEQTLTLVQYQSARAEEAAELDVQIDPDLAGRYEVACRALARAEEAKRSTSAAIMQAIGGGRRAMVGTTAIAARQRSRGDSVYLRADGKLLATYPSTRVPKPRASAETPAAPAPAATGSIADSLDWMLGRATTKAQVTALMEVLAPRLSDDDKARARARWREVA